MEQPEHKMALVWDGTVGGGPACHAKALGPRTHNQENM